MEFRKAILYLLFLFPLSYAWGQSNVSVSDASIYEEYVEQFSSLYDEPMEKLVIKTALFFQGRPYVGATLEADGAEKLTVNLREFDCTTFVESCIALSKVIKSEDHSYANYQAQLTNIRYRGGKIDGYISRLHYPTDWIYENEKTNLLDNISILLGGNKTDKDINYMSTHPQAYKHLKDNSSNLRLIADKEKEIRQRGEYIVIPISRIANVSFKIRDGDIIVFATNIAGLDYSHIGIAYRSKGALRFIHASSLAKKVVVESKTLTEYCTQSKRCSGITVLRLKQDHS